MDLQVVECMDRTRLRNKIKTFFFWNSGNCQNTEISVCTFQFYESPYKYGRTFTHALVHANLNWVWEWLHIKSILYFPFIIFYGLSWCFFLSESAFCTICRVMTIIITFPNLTWYGLKCHFAKHPKYISFPKLFYEPWQLVSAGIKVRGCCYSQKGLNPSVML